VPSMVGGSARRRRVPAMPAVPGMVSSRRPLGVGGMCVRARGAFRDGAHRPGGLALLGMLRVAGLRWLLGVGRLVIRDVGRGIRARGATMFTPAAVTVIGGAVTGVIVTGVAVVIVAVTSVVVSHRTAPALKGRGPRPLRTCGAAKTSESR